MRNANERFERFATRLGFKVLHGKRDRDIDEVVYKGLKQFSVPSRMNAWPNALYNWHGMMLPNLHELEVKGRMYWFRKNFSHYFQETIKEYANQKFNPKEYEVSEQN